MKKLMIAAVGLAFALGTISFASPSPKQDQKTTMEKKSKKKKKSTM